jgi:hypothetical protein
MAVRPLWTDLCNSVTFNRRTGADEQLMEMRKGY